MKSILIIAILALASTIKHPNDKFQVHRGMERNSEGKLVPKENQQDALKKMKSPEKVPQEEKKIRGVVPKKSESNDVPFKIVKDKNGQEQLEWDPSIKSDEIIDFENYLEEKQKKYGDKKINEVEEYKKFKSQYKP